MSRDYTMARKTNTLEVISRVFMAGDRGFEPLHTDPESAVLPLDEPPEKAAARTCLAAVYYHNWKRIASASLAVAKNLYTVGK
jgi:hypothetical protein